MSDNIGQEQPAPLVCNVCGGEFNEDWPQFAPTRQRHANFEVCADRLEYENRELRGRVEVLERVAAAARHKLHWHGRFGESECDCEVHQALKALDAAQQGVGGEEATGATI